MDTKYFFRSKKDRRLRRASLKKLEIKKEVEEASISISEMIPSLKKDVVEELALYGYCLIVRQANGISVVNGDKFQFGFKAVE